MAKNPDPNLKLASTKGVTRTLDDWSTMFHLCLVILPPRPEASVYIPIAKRIFQVFGDADCRTVLCVVGNEFIAKSVLGEAEQQYLSFVDTDGELARASGSPTCRRSCTSARTPRWWLPRRAGTRTRGSGWPRKWAKAMAWSVPTVAGAGDPPPTPGWPV